MMIHTWHMILKLLVWMISVTSYEQFYIHSYITNTGRLYRTEYWYSKGSTSILTIYFRYLFRKDLINVMWILYYVITLTYMTCFITRRYLIQLLLSCWTCEQNLPNMNIFSYYFQDLMRYWQFRHRKHQQLSYSEWNMTCLVECRTYIHLITSTMTMITYKLLHRD